MVPKGWEKRNLQGYISIKHGFAFKSEYFTDSGTLVLLTPGSFYEDGGFRDQKSKTKYYFGEVPDGYLLSKDDMLLAMTEQAEGLLGSALFVPENDKYLHNQRLGLVQILNPSKICLEFLYLFFNNPSSRKQITEQSTGTKVKHTSPDRLCSVVGLIPPISEQKKIAQILSTWDQTIATTECLLDLARQQKKALMQQLLTGKKRFPGFEGAWLRKSLGEFGEIKSAGVDKKIVDGEIPVRLLNYTDVFKRNFIYSSELNHWVSAPPQKVVGCNVECGDVFFTPSSETREDVGMPAVAAEDIDECCYSYHVVRFRIKEKWDLNFKAYAFTTPIFRSQVTTLADGSGQRYVVSQDSFRSIVVHYPLYEEQVRIGAAIKTAEDEEQLWERKISCLRKEKKALMQALLTGKRRVSVDE